LIPQRNRGKHLSGTPRLKPSYTTLTSTGVLTNRFNNACAALTPAAIVW